MTMGNNLKIKVKLTVLSKLQAMTMVWKSRALAYAVETGVGLTETSRRAFTSRLRFPCLPVCEPDVMLMWNLPSSARLADGSTAVREIDPGAKTSAVV